MRVLVACETSGEVRRAFREREAMRPGLAIYSPPMMGRTTTSSQTPWTRSGKAGTWWSRIRRVPFYAPAACTGTSAGQSDGRRLTPPSVSLCGWYVGARRTPSRGQLKTPSAACPACIANRTRLFIPMSTEKMLAREHASGYTGCRCSSQPDMSNLGGSMASLDGQIKLIPVKISYPPVKIVGRSDRRPIVALPEQWRASGDEEKIMGAYSRREVEFIKNNWGKISPTQIARALNRSRPGISERAAKMGLKSWRAIGHTNRSFTKEEDEYIKNNYLLCSVKDMAKKLNRSKTSIYHRAKKLECTRPLKRWTRDEDEVLLNPQGRQQSEIAEILGRCPSEIYARCKKLGLDKWSRHKNGGIYSLYRGYAVRRFEYLGKPGKWKRIMEHIAVKEKQLNRKLKPGEIVHHINEDKLDNDINNLFLCADAYEHRMLHVQRDNLKKKHPENKIMFNITRRCYFVGGQE